MLGMTYLRVIIGLLVLLGLCMLQIPPKDWPCLSFMQPCESQQPSSP